jgi:hypothetical protein
LKKSTCPRQSKELVERSAPLTPEPDLLDWMRIMYSPNYLDGHLKKLKRAAGFKGSFDRPIKHFSFGQRSSKIHRGLDCLVVERVDPTSAPYGAGETSLSPSWRHAVHQVPARDEGSETASDARDRRRTTRQRQRKPRHDGVHCGGRPRGSPLAMFDPRFGSKPPAVVVAETMTDASGADRRTSARVGGVDD